VYILQVPELQNYYVFKEKLKNKASQENYCTSFLAYDVIKSIWLLERAEP